MTRRQAVQVVKSPVIWILVADAKQAQVYTRQKVEKRMPVAGNPKNHPFEEIIAIAPVPVAGMQWEAEDAGQYETGRNATGMVFESAGSARHMSEPHLYAQDEVRLHFAKTIATHLNEAMSQKSFDRLVLVAPAKMLGEIKKQLNAKVLKQVVAELPKDLTHFEGKDLAVHLDSII